MRLLVPPPSPCIACLRVRLKKSVVDYYIDMSAAAEGKIAGLKTPLLAVSALDDPIMTAAGSPIDDLETVEDLFILLTRWDRVLRKCATLVVDLFVCFFFVSTPGECGDYTGGNAVTQYVGNKTPDSGCCLVPRWTRFRILRLWWLFQGLRMFHTVRRSGGT